MQAQRPESGSVITLTYGRIVNGSDGVNRLTEEEKLRLIEINKE